MTTELLKQARLKALTAAVAKPRIHIRSDLLGSFPPIIVHAAKIDLRVGTVFSPGADVSRPTKKEIIVPPGGVFVVETLERFELDYRHVGICSPKSSMVGQRGIFIANVGQVDPGYHGWLNFTCVNFSGKPHTVRVLDPIASVMILQLETSDVSEWRGEPNTAQKVFDEGALDSHFGAVQAQIRHAVTNRVQKAMFNATTASWLVGIVVAILLSSWATTMTLNQINADTMERATVEASKAVDAIAEKRMTSMQQEISTIQAAVLALSARVQQTESPKPAE